MFNEESILKEIETSEYVDFGEAYSEVRDVLVLELRRYLLPANHSWCQFFKPNPKGVYAPHIFGPIADFENHKYREATQAELDKDYKPRHVSYPITDFESFIKAKGIVVNEQGTKVATNPASLAKVLKPEADYSLNAAVGLSHIVVDELRESVLHRKAPICTSFKGTLDDCLLPQYRSDKKALRDEYLRFAGDSYEAQVIQKAMLVDPDYVQDLLARLELTHEEVVQFEEFSLWGNPTMGTLLSRVREFIGRDSMNKVNLRLEGSTLYIEKGNDFRVLAYYQNLFDQADQIHTEKYGF